MSDDPLGDLGVGSAGIELPDGEPVAVEQAPEPEEAVVEAAPEPEPGPVAEPAPEAEPEAAEEEVAEPTGLETFYQVLAAAETPAETAEAPAPGMDLRQMGVLEGRLEEQGKRQEALEAELKAWNEKKTEQPASADSDADRETQIAVFEQLGLDREQAEIAVEAQRVTVKSELEKQRTQDIDPLKEQMAARAEAEQAAQASRVQQQAMVTALTQLANMGEMEAGLVADMAAGTQQTGKWNESSVLYRALKENGGGDPRNIVTTGMATARLVERVIAEAKANPDIMKPGVTTSAASARRPTKVEPSAKPNTHESLEAQLAEEMKNTDAPVSQLLPELFGDDAFK